MVNLRIHWSCSTTQLIVVGNLSINLTRVKGFSFLLLADSSLHGWRFTSFVDLRCFPDFLWRTFQTLRRWGENDTEKKHINCSTIRPLSFSFLLCLSVLFTPEYLLAGIQPAFCVRRTYGVMSQRPLKKQQGLCSWKTWQTDISAVNLFCLTFRPGKSRFAQRKQGASSANPHIQLQIVFRCGEECGMSSLVLAV